MGQTELGISILIARLSVPIFHLFRILIKVVDIRNRCSLNPQIGILSRSFFEGCKMV